MLLLPGSCLIQISRIRTELLVAQPSFDIDSLNKIVDLLGEMRSTQLNLLFLVLFSQFDVLLDLVSLV